MLLYTSKSFDNLYHYCFALPWLPHVRHPSDLPVVITAIAIVGKFSMSASFTNVYVYASELYPTNLR